MPTLRFDAPTHTYTLDGKVLPSVTQILKPLYDFSAVPADVLERKRQIGTAVHKAIELDLLDDLDPDSLAPEVAPYFAAWVRFKTEFRPESQGGGSEVRVHTASYAGTVDLITGRVGHSDTWVIDYKTSAQVGPVVALQTAAYAHAAHEMGVVPHGPKRATLHLLPTGLYKLIEHKDRNDIRVFQSLLIVHQWRQANGC